MCGGGGGQDNSDKVAAIEAQAAREAREAAAAEAARKEQQFIANLNSAFGTGVQGAQDYFTMQGLDPSEYMNAITSRANAVRGTVPQGDLAPGTYFNNLGEQVWQMEQEAARNKAMRGLDSFAPTGFASKRITNDVDDEFINAIIEEQLQGGDNYIRNLLDRGVITGSGYTAAQKNLQNQRSGASARLQELGLGILEGGRAGAENILADARSSASNLRLGTAFDPYSYQGDVNNYFSDFFNNLGDKLRGAAPTNLFDTAGLAGIAGAAQGAQNTAFNPLALGGVNTDDDEETSGPVATSPF